jgi:hypothetical protein
VGWNQPGQTRFISGQFFDHDFRQFLQNNWGTTAIILTNNFVIKSFAVF